MTDKVYFVSETVVKENTPISLNVETQLINNAIIDSQIMHIQMQTGSDLYNKLTSLISAGTITDPANVKYKLLLDDYVVPATIQWTLAECLPYIRYKIMNKSVSGQNSDNSTPMDLQELKFLQAKFTDKAEFYSQRLANFLLANLTDYPEYYAANDIDDIVPESNAYHTGMVLGDPDLCESMWKRVRTESYRP
jgi:hypothetical protein